MQVRNLSVLVFCQLISATGSIVMVTLGGIIGSTLSSNKALATLPLSMMVVAVALTTIPATMLMRRIGRRKGFALASLTAALALCVAVFALQERSFILYIAGAMLFGINMAFSQQYRYAAAESVSAKYVPRAISLVLVGSIGGAFLGPELAKRGQFWVESIPYAGSLMVLVILFVIQSMLFLIMHPGKEPLDIAAKSGSRSLSQIAKQPLFIVAVLGGTVGYGLMTLVMTATPLSMHINDGYSLQETADVIRAHVLGMYVPSLVAGFLIEKLGVHRMMFAGALCLVATSIIGLQGHSVLHYWWALVLLGVGWNFLYVGGTTLLTYTYSGEERFGAQAVNEFLVFGTSATASLLAGTVMHLFGWGTLMLIPMPILIIICIAIIAIRNDPKLKTEEHCMADNSRLRELLGSAAERSINYRELGRTRSVQPADAAVEALEVFREDFPETGSDDAEVLDMLDSAGSPATVMMTAGRYFGFVIGGSMPVTVASNWLATAWDQNTGLHKISPASAVLEQVSGKWLLDAFNLPADAATAFVTGATVANFTALAAARNRVLNNVGWDVEADGLLGAPAVTVILSEESHPTVYKSLGMLGFGRNRVLRAPVDSQGRIDITQFPEFDGPTIICTQAGNVNTGAFDPVADIVALARPKQAWVHVDGAFGLWAAASPEQRHLCVGVETADSWATDAHKWLNVPYDSGIAFVRDAEALKSAMAIKAEYLPTDSTFRNPSDYTPELSRRARGVDVWAALKSLGRRGVADMIARCCRHARRFGTELSAAGFDVLNEVVLNQVLVSFGDAEITERIVAAIQRDGTCWCGPTVWQDRSAVRISVCNWSTTDEDVSMSLEAIIRIANEQLNLVAD